MFSAIASFLASLSLSLKQPLTAYCDLETTHDDALITKGGHHCTWLRVDGMQRMRSVQTTRPSPRPCVSISPAR